MSWPTDLKSVFPLFYRVHHSEGGLIIFASNSSRSKNGHRSSIGLVSIDPSALFDDETRGAVNWFSVISTSHMTGPGVSKICFTFYRMSLWLVILSKGKS